MKVDRSEALGGRRLYAARESRTERGTLDVRLSSVEVETGSVYLRAKASSF